MKIIYPYPMHIIKGYTYMLSIIQFLNTLSEKVSVELLCLDSKEAIQSYLNNSLDIELNPNLKVVQISNKRFGIKSNKFFFINNTLNYLEQLKTEKIIIYTRDFKQMRLLIKNLKHKSLNIRFVFEVHQILSQNYCREGQYQKAKAMKNIEQYVFSGVDNLICITSTLSSEIKKVFPSCVKNHHILPIGFNKNFLRINHLSEKPYDIIYSGNFSPWKGLDILVEAISIIKHQHHRDVLAILIGADKHSRKKFEDQVEALNVSDNVIIIERIAHRNIYQYIAQSKVGVLANKYDADGLLFTSPLKLYEYLGSGLKVVVSRLPSIESAIDPALVYYAKPESPSDLAQTIISSLDDDDFDINKVKDFARDFTWESRVRRFMQIIQ